MTQFLILTSGYPDELPNESRPNHVICGNENVTKLFLDPAFPQLRVRNWEYKKKVLLFIQSWICSGTEDVSDDTLGGQRDHLVLGEAEAGTEQQLQVCK